MTDNLGTPDRILRAALGLTRLFVAFLSGLPVFAAPLFKYGAALVGAVTLAASVLRFCPLYARVGTTTCRSR